MPYSLNNCFSLLLLFYCLFVVQLVHHWHIFSLLTCDSTQELQKALDKRKAIVLSINLCSAEFVQSDSEEARDLQRRLKEMNNRWERLSSSLDEWRNALQHALMQCQARNTSPTTDLEAFIRRCTLWEDIHKFCFHNSSASWKNAADLQKKKGLMLPNYLNVQFFQFCHWPQF